jgi:hypothetical protein
MSDSWRVVTQRFTVAVVADAGVAGVAGVETRSGVSVGLFAAQGSGAGGNGGPRQPGARAGSLSGFCCNRHSVIAECFHRHRYILSDSAKQQSKDNDDRNRHPNKVKKNSSSHLYFSWIGYLIELPYFGDIIISNKARNIHSKSSKSPDIFWYFSVIITNI